MNKLFTLLCIFILQSGFSQIIAPISRIPSGTAILPNEAPAENTGSTFQIVIENLPLFSEELTELSVSLEKKGTYSFILDPKLILPENYSIVIQDPRTGNTFSLPSTEPHAFSINRPLTKTFNIQVRKPLLTLVTCK